MGWDFDIHLGHLDCRMLYSHASCSGKTLNKKASTVPTSNQSSVLCVTFGDSGMAAALERGLVISRYLHVS